MQISTGATTSLWCAARPRKCWAASTGISGLLVVGACSTFIDLWLSYCSCVCPQYHTHISKLEKVQLFAARIVSQDWKGDAETLRSDLGWCPLATRRAFHKMSLCVESWPMNQSSPFLHLLHIPIRHLAI